MDSAGKRSKPELTDTQRQAIYLLLLSKSKEGKLPRGSLTAETAKIFNVCDRTVRRIWKQGVETGSDIYTPANVSSKKHGRCGRRAIPADEIQSRISSLSLSDRQTYRRMEHASGINKDVLVRARKRGVIIRHSNAVKPALSHSNKLKRLEYALSNIEFDRTSTLYKFKNMNDVIHIDEKWFNLYFEKETYYLSPEEIEPYHSTQSKRFIGRVMFLCAVARPRYDSHRRKYFDGKIGIWPFVTEEVAQRNSRNRMAGTVELKPLNVTKEVYTDYLINKVFPAVRSKFPFKRYTTVSIQQDNARPHINPNDSAILEANKYDTHSIKIVCQPPNSPDFNVLDLGFFNAIQSLQVKTRSSSVSQIIESVEEAFYSYPFEKLLDVFLTLQTVIERAMEDNGGNKFKIPHIGKQKMSFESKLEYNHTCDTEIYTNAYNFYHQN